MLRDTEDLHRVNLKEGYHVSQVRPPPTAERRARGIIKRFEMGVTPRKQTSATPLNRPLCAVCNPDAFAGSRTPSHGTRGFGRLRAKGPLQNGDSGFDKCAGLRARHDQFAAELAQPLAHTVDTNSQPGRSAFPA